MYRGGTKSPKIWGQVQRPEATKAQTLPIKKGKEKGNYT